VDPERYSETIDRWLDYDQELGIEAIGYGAVILRRREGSNWVRADSMHGSLVGLAGEQVSALLEVQDLLASLDEPDAILDLVCEANPRHRLEQVLRPGDDGYEVGAASVVLEEGIGFRAAVDMHSMQLLVRLDGKRSLREVVEEAREAVEPEMGAGEFASAAVRALRRMIELGFVRPAG
jgi:hypothetical protein